MNSKVEVVYRNQKLSKPTMSGRDVERATFFTGTIEGVTGLWFRGVDGLCSVGREEPREFTLNADIKDYEPQNVRIEVL